MKIHKKNKIDKWQHRFSIFIICLIVGQNFFVYFFVFFQGFGFWKFKLNDYIFYLLIIGNLSTKLFFG